jgi:adenine deaminase
MDGHIHVESSLMTAPGYASAVTPRGTTAIFADPHEIGNVFGMKGVRFMMEDAENAPLRFLVALPSCVPAVDGFEDVGAEITPADIAEMLDLETVCGLGEVMNFPGVLAGDDKMHDEIRLTLEKNKTVTGHYSLPESGSGLNGYIAAGARCDHETVRKEDALAKMRTELVRAITETKLDTRYACLVSDDVHTHTLIEDGHLDHIVRRAVSEGVDPVTAIQMVTINAAQCYNMDRDLGSISPGRVADLVLFSDLNKIDVSKVFINGELVAEDGRLCNDPPPKEYPDWVKRSMNMGQALTPEDFIVTAPQPFADNVTAKVMEVIGTKIGSRERRLRLPVTDGLVAADLSQDICKAAVIERHKGTGRKAFGFVKGFGIKAGAVATTVAHDAHNLLVIGADDGDMALAANTLSAAGGGMTVVRGGRVLALLPLPVAGLMSDEPAEIIIEKNSALEAAWREIADGDMVSPFMTMAFLSLPVLPELRLTNRGLVDTVRFGFTELFTEG